VVNELSTEAAVLQVAERLAEAERTGDVAALEQILASDYQGYDPAGRPQDRAAVLRGYGVGRVRMGGLIQSELKARVLGDAAVVAGINALQGHDGPEHFHFRLRFLDVYALRDGRWQLVASQDTLLPG
jgi:ketosteroid isomerase-like protein